VRYSTTDNVPLSCGGRGSKLVVFFDEQDSAVGLTEPDLSLA
jgi:hypothetical protein